MDSYLKKYEAENAAQKIKGVKALVENIKVEFGTGFERSDAEIANDVLAGFKKSWEVPDDKIKVIVENGTVTLSGEVPWFYQKTSARSLVNSINGVVSVINNILINPESKDRIEKHVIEHAFLRSSAVSDSQIIVSVNDNDVTLTGEVDSWYKRDEAARLAWKTPGISSVRNEIVIDYDL